MEIELFSNVVSEEDTVEVEVEVDAENDNLGAEAERCGICMDVVIDRGVLDCCQHWFCFVCIDNWATITNLCPLCQNEFQLITCVSVYDTAGSNNNDEDSDSRDDDWCVEGNNSTLSLPSYYIDENAVTCLDGGGCKMRSGSVTYEETLTLDTSIACDACDIWYHAFCVGFDPEGTGVDSWLCPRCLVNEADQNTDLKETHLTGKNVDHHLVDTSSGKVSICVADTGETAVVVSRIDSKDVVDELIMNLQSNRELTHHCKAERSMLCSDCLPEMKKPSVQGIDSIQPESNVPSAKFRETVIKSEPDESESRMSLDVGPGLASTLSGDKDKNLSGGDECLNGASTDESLEDVKADIAPRLGLKRKHPGHSSQEIDDNGHHEGKLVGASSAKKVKAQRRTRNTSLNDQADVCTPGVLKKKRKLIERSAVEVDGNSTVKKNQPIDIMSIVQEVKLSTENRLAHKKNADKCASVEKISAGLRVKKIMRRPSEEKESEAVVQKLKKEIREAVRKKSSDDIGKNILDPNLLTAFRAAVAGSVAEPAKKASSAMIKAKKLMLQKGKARENLTKKIYATSSGKRRRAWDRDCEIEFWKHRCLTTSKPEKIDTLRSVLSLLQKRPEAKNIVEHTSEEDTEAPILSRLYLADTSLFPRKDDIKPLSFLKAAAASSNQNNTLSSGEKCIESGPDNGTTKSLNRIVDPAQSNSTDDKKKTVCASGNNGAASGKFHANGLPNKVSPQKKMTGKTNDVKIDKRKWALEVLARKNASGDTSSMHQKQENDVLKANYPLLAELPTDMRPELAPTRQNKIAISVRQAQLHRLTEHFLKMTNLSSMHRTAETELAVADAINIEKQVADRSNSKAVYLNLCSQEIRSRTNCNTSDTLASSPVPVSSPSSPAPVPLKDDQSSTSSPKSEAEAALRAAGLLSDSPPSSPLHKVVDLNVDDDTSLGEDKEEELKSIFEMECQPDLDIYGDFEYNLDEEDYIGATAVNASKAQPEEGESKVKVIFSTLNSIELDNAAEAKEEDLPKTDTLSTPSMPECPNDADSGSSPMEDKMDSVPFPGDTSLDGEGEELSLAECEALYGPDKEQSTKHFSFLVPADNSGLQTANDLDTSNSDKNKETTDSLHSIIVGENSSNSSVPKETSEKEKKTDPKVDKKSEHAESVLKKVEAYIKEHIRPLCKSGVITVEQYRWAVAKTTEKVMKYHSKAKNANFLIKEGEKVKKLAGQYIETAKHKENK
ncbi:hypothetical protein SOVF_074350 isoform A [Spinacia oleracea]|uniref:Uncharacterized protein At4g10930 isoform X1 n=2 Tax=Spinacia oleracea TaxID=3562 RepID=A0A9R0IEG2_SPIOL|nr:uncharacterized protein At4g10930 isoform X1 [Spinacia oleracea]KNA18066.1 hypothetical protein SOVF_074350 isoform A [Spinacia oleracea]